MTTPVTSAAACPDCGGALTDDERFTRWCPACRWNALPRVGQPKTPDPDPSARQRLAGRLDSKAEERLFTEVSAAAAEGRTLRPTMSLAWCTAMVLALPVHVVTLAVLALGCRLLSSAPGSPTRSVSPCC